MASGQTPLERSEGGRLSPDCASGVKRTDAQCVCFARRHPGKSRWNQIPEFSPPAIRIHVVSSIHKVLQRFAFLLPWMQPWALEFETSGFVTFVQHMKMIEWKGGN